MATRTRKELMTATKPERIELADVHGESLANNAFIGAELTLDKVIALLQAARKNHLGMSGEKMWADSCTAVSLVNRLVEATNILNGYCDG